MITQADELSNNNIRVILEDDEGNIWLGTFGGGVSRYDGKTFKTFKDIDGLPSNFILSGLKDREGNLWFGTDNGLSRFDGKSFTAFIKKDGLEDPYIFSMAEGEHGNIWLGTRSAIFLFDGKAFKAFGEKQGFYVENLNTMLVDKTGNLWLGTIGKGVFRFDGDAFTNLTTSQGLVNNIARSFLEDKQGNLWITTEGGLSRYDGKTFTNFTMAQGLINKSLISSFLDSRGNIWIGTRNGVSRYDGKSFTNYTSDQGLSGNYVRAIVEDGDKNLWFATDKGVSKFDGSTFTSFTTDQGLAGNKVLSILIDSQGLFWFGTDEGVSTFDGKTFVTYTKNEGLPSNFIMATLEDQEGKLWIGSSYGLSRFDGESFLNFSVENGLPDNIVYQMALTEEGDLAVGTNLGVTLLKGFTTKPESVLIEIPAQNKLLNRELKDTKPIFEIYNTLTGYPIKDANAGQNSIYLDSHGNLWIGTGSNNTGVVKFNYKAVHKSKNPPTLEFTKIKLNNEDIIWYDLENIKPTTSSVPPYVTEEAIMLGTLLDEQQREAMRETYAGVKFEGISPFYYIPENLKLPYGVNNITLEFGAIEPAFPQDVLYQYKMSGYDKDWSAPSNMKKAVYGNMFEGNYVFSVKARSPFGVWSEPLNYSFRVNPPWYRNWLAYLIYASSLLTAGYLAYQSRIKFLKERQEQLEKLYAATERFVPKAFLTLLKKDHIEDVKLGDSTELELTIMFSDIRGFTTIAEKQSPAEAFAFINDYLAVMAPIIRKNHGFINQYHGDGIMALFPRKADDSIKAVQEMSQALSLFNQQQEKKSKPQLGVGYGLNTGLAMLGIIGEEERMEANVISDAINLAARTEGLNKFYGTSFLVTEGTMEALPGEKGYRSRIVDKVRVKGKSLAVYLYEIYIDNNFQEEFIRTYESAFKHYEKGEFIDALRLFKECLLIKPMDKSVKVLIDRCETFLKSPPAGWDGAFEMAHK
jgi:ligand-binding sensor domain-containing protein/class 3 adenylate cyclase